MARRAVARRRNLATALPVRRSSDPMGDFDRLPEAARRWLSTAVLPWSARSVARLWTRAMVETGGDATLAAARLSAIQQAVIARDARRVWGARYPEARAAGCDRL